MLNRILIMGRITRDLEIKQTPSNVAVVSFGVAVDRDFARQGEQRETDFIDVVAWRQTAEFVVKYFKKGQMIAIDGRLQTRKWKDKFEQNRVSVEVVADNVYFADSKPSGEGHREDGPGYGEAPPFNDKPRYAQASPRQDSGRQEAKLPPASDFSELADDDDVPF